MPLNMTPTDPNFIQAGNSYASRFTVKNLKSVAKYFPADPVAEKSEFQLFFLYRIIFTDPYIRDDIRRRFLLDAANAFDNSFFESLFNDAGLAFYTTIPLRTRHKECKLDDLPRLTCCKCATQPCGSCKCYLNKNGAVCLGDNTYCVCLDNCDNGKISYVGVGNVVYKHCLKFNERGNNDQYTFFNTALTMNNPHNDFFTLLSNLSKSQNDNAIEVARNYKYLLFLFPYIIMISEDNRYADEYSNIDSKDFRREYFTHLIQKYGLPHNGDNLCDSLDDAYQEGRCNIGCAGNCVQNEIPLYCIQNLIDKLIFEIG
jgi:hypothetical protein